MPTKAVAAELYDLFDEDPDQEWQYVLADRLRRPVYELDNMSRIEYVGWQVYLGRKAQQEELARMTRRR